MIKHLFCIVSLCLVASGCVSTSTFTGIGQDLTIYVNDKAPASLDAQPQDSYATKGFGQYRFKIEQGDETVMHGLMPLKFNGGYLALDILFFAPAIFFNVREMFRFYEFDPAAETIRYKKKEGDRWTEYQPTAAEVEGAREYFGKQD